MVTKGQIADEDLYCASDLDDKFHLILKAAETTLPSFGHF